MLDYFDQSVSDPKVKLDSCNMLVASCINMLTNVIASGLAFYRSFYIIDFLLLKYLL